MIQSPLLVWLNLLTYFCIYSVLGTYDVHAWYDTRCRTKCFQFCKLITCHRNDGDDEINEDISSSPSPLSLEWHDTHCPTFLSKPSVQELQSVRCKKKKKLNIRVTYYEKYNTPPDTHWMNYLTRTKSCAWMTTKSDFCIICVRCIYHRYSIIDGSVERFSTETFMIELYTMK